MSKPLLFIGIMSGSSLDGIDVALTELTNDGCKVIATHFSAYDAATKNGLMALHFPQENELEKAALMANQLAHLYAEAVKKLLVECNIDASRVSAIGCHGQTIRHQPDANVANSYTMQLNNHAMLAELTDITVVGDFRSRDMAAGGQGAPLVPAFHEAIFANDQHNRAIVNIGGIANISYLARSGDVTGFDSGPGNILIDHWVTQQTGQDYDANGQWSSTGRTDADLLSEMLAEPYFSLAAPKSTGRDLFNASWLSQQIGDSTIKPEDVARTLVELSATTICDAMKQYCPKVDEVYLCGGGAHNQLLVEIIKQKLPETPVLMTDDLGVNVDWVEAAAFAWLAHQTIVNKPGNLPAATGAKGLRILGAVYPK